MKLSKDELIKKVNESDISDEMKVSLMEDITDSFEKEVDLSAFIEKAKYDELLEKYKSRFLDGEKETEEKKEDETEELKEEEIIDVKEI